MSTGPTSTPSTPTGSSAVRRRLQRGPADPANAVYPHDLHPALVPGVSIDNQRNRYGIDKLVFGVAAVVTLAVTAWGLLSTESLSTASGAALGWVVRNMGWLFNSLAIVILIYMLLLAFAPTGRIRLGTDDERPEFGVFSWAAMMFGAGVGVGIFFFGPSEALYFFLEPPAEGVAPGSREAMHKAVAQTYFHWGLQAWALYGFVGAALAYGTYRRGRLPLMSSILTPLLGLGKTEGVLGRIVDIISILATLFGTATSLGLAAIQIGRGVEIVTGIGPVGNAGLIAIIGVLGAAFIVSAVSGVSRGIRILSNLNMTMVGLIVLFVFVTGPTLLLVNLIPSSLMQYLNDLWEMAGRSGSWGPEAEAFGQAWTIFYWAWWISWMPFVGLFLARISRGRTLREFVIGVLLAPMVVVVAAFTIFGGTTIDMAAQGSDIAEGTTENILFDMLASLPGGGVVSALTIVAICIFFVTSADSASLVMGMMSQKGAPNPRHSVVVFWGVAMAAIAVVMLLIGGGSALQGLQNLVTVAALPLAIVVVVMMVAFWRDVHSDPLLVRRRYGEEALANAVRTGVSEHGDDFAIAVEPTPEGEGAGHFYDSTAEANTAWYQRTDEEGNPVDYDYATGEYADGWTPEGDAPAQAAADSRVEAVGEDDPSAFSGPRAQA